MCSRCVKVEILSPGWPSCCWWWSIYPLLTGSTCFSCAQLWVSEDPHPSLAVCRPAVLLCICIHTARLEFDILLACCLSFEHVCVSIQPTDALLACSQKRDISTFEEISEALGLWGLLHGFPDPPAITAKLQPSSFFFSAQLAEGPFYVKRTKSTSHSRVPAEDSLSFTRWPRHTPSCHQHGASGHRVTINRDDDDG